MSMYLKLICTILVAVGTTVGASAAATWYVDATNGNDENSGMSWETALATIQSAVDKTASGDDVLVNDGTYSPFRLAKDSYPVTYLALNVRSVNGPYKTIIECGLGEGVVLGNGYDYPTYGSGFHGPNGTIEGFTIRGGGRLPPYNTYPVSGGYVKRCIITGSRGYTPIQACIVFNSVFYGNTITGETGDFLSEFSESKLYNCTVYESHGCKLAYGTSSRFYNCILYGNFQKPTDGYGHTVGLYNCFDSDPKFVNLDALDFRLTADSPCVNAGNNSYDTYPIDLAGNVRINDGTIDIGALEYYPQTNLVITISSAKQRYPWNGKVDVNFKVEGVAGESYVVSFLAKDLTGGTNINMRTMYKANGIAVNVDGEGVTSGNYNWVWDAAADLPDGFECERVTVEANVE